MTLKRPHITLLFSLLVLITIVLAFLDIVLGSIKIQLEDVIKAMFGEAERESWQYIIREIRMPRVVTTLLAGSGLAVAGLLMQSLFRNPLAGPYVLGISSGASLGVAIFVMSSGMAIFGTEVRVFAEWGQVISAVAGSLLVFLLIILVAAKLRDSVSLLIVGIMFGSMSTALVSILQYFSRPDLVQKFVIWTMGSLSSTTWDQLIVLSPFILSGLIMSITLIKPMNALLLGENNARATGVNVIRLRYLILITASIIIGALTAYTGPIAFIGLAVPHLVRLLFGSGNHRLILPGSILSGAALLLICDILSQVPGRNYVLPVNAITALFGGPVILWIIIGRKRLRSSF
jgi:iron complex transport system permease protein